MRTPRLLSLCLLSASCATAPQPKAAPEATLWPEETHLAELRQLTFGGENAEAYWSFDNQWLSFQAHGNTGSCDRIYRMRADQRPPVPVQISSGKGATTCSHYFPGGAEVLYASTHLSGDACPPRPDMSQGYVWALYDTYDLFKANVDGTNLRQLTHQKGYDAEATVCARDGSIIFTSTRDGDIELYRMDKDGQHVKRLTFTPGYDGGAFFNADCSKIVWRASRPKEGKELDEFRGLLAQGLVRPTRLELFVANADGSDPRQVTYLNCASFAPFWVPGQDRLLFASNYPNPRGREFDIWAINADGTELERITHAPGFDGFPMLSPDGQTLAFSSNRATAEGQSDTNVFLAKWVDGPVVPAEVTGADRIRADVRWLADPAREGRGLGLPGLTASGAYLEQRLQALGLQPFGEGSSFRQPFAAATALAVGAGTSLKLGADAVPADAFTPLGFSAQGKANGALVLAGYGLVDPDLGVDDYRGLDVKGKVVVVRRFAPELPALDTAEKQRRAGDLRKKAFLARERGAVALLVVDAPSAPTPLPKDWQAPSDAALPGLHPEGTTGDAGLPVLVVKRAVLEKLLPALEKKGGRPVNAELTVALTVEKTDAFNVVGVLRASSPTLPPLIIGAHYDHLGMGGKDSLAPGLHQPHLGADDNASGTATVLEIARLLAAEKGSLQRDVVIALFSGEEWGVLGSAHFVAARPELVKPGAVMINLDMVGRSQANHVTALGTESAPEWKGLLEQACTAARLDCTGSGDGYGPSDQTPFYAAGLPVLHFFTGAHGDYHKPSDTPDKLSYGGASQVAVLVAALAEALQTHRLTYQRLSATPAHGDQRSFGASLGTVPNYGGPPNGQKGVLLDDVRPGGGAALGGLQRGDVLVKLGATAVGSVEDLMFVLQGSKPGQTVTAVVLRDGREVRLEVTFQEGRRR